MDANNDTNKPKRIISKWWKQIISRWWKPTVSVLIVFLLLALCFILWRNASNPYREIDDHIKEEVKKQLDEKDSILTKQVQKYADTCTTINVDLYRLDSCTKTEIKYLVSEASRQNLVQYINEENNHLTVLAILIAALVSIVGIGFPMFYMRRQLEKIEEIANEVENAKRNIKTIENSVKKIKQDVEGYRNEAQVAELFAKARAKQDLEEKIDIYKEIIKLQPKNSAAYCNRGVAYKEEGEYDKAIKDYNEAIELNPKYDRAYNCRGVVYKEKSKYDKAIKDYNKAIELNPKYVSAYNNRGTAYKEKSDYDKAIKDYNKAIDLNSRYDRAYNNIGMVYSLKYKMKPAIENFKKAINLKPDKINEFNLEMGKLLQSAIKLKEKKDIKKARTKAQEGLKKAEEAKAKDWIAIFQKFLDELPPEK